MSIPKSWTSATLWDTTDAKKNLSVSKQSRRQAPMCENMTVFAMSSRSCWRTHINMKRKSFSPDICLWQSWSARMSSGTAPPSACTWRPCTWDRPLRRTPARWSSTTPQAAEWRKLWADRPRTSVGWSSTCEKSWLDEGRWPRTKHTWRRTWLLNGSERPTYF